VGGNNNNNNNNNTNSSNNIVGVTTNYIDKKKIESFWSENYILMPL